MQEVIDACHTGRLGAKPRVVISNNSHAEALARAQQAAIPAYHVSSKTHPFPEQLGAEILRLLLQYEVELVLLAGYVRKLGVQTLRRYRNRTMNINPALPPKFGGQRMYGAAVHEAMLAAGEKETGVTIHLVDEEYDHGAILAQGRMPVLKEDTVVSLAQKVLEREHSFLIETLERILAGELLLLFVAVC